MSLEDTLARLADAAEVIAAHLTGADAPRTAAGPSTTTTKDSKPPTAAEKKAAEKAAKEKADKAKKDEKPAEDDPFGAADKGKKGKIEEADVRAKLSAVIEQDGKAAAFEIMRDKGGGAKNFTELKPEHYEDVYTECVERLG